MGDSPHSRLLAISSSVVNLWFPSYILVQNHLKSMYRFFIAHIFHEPSEGILCIFIWGTIVGQHA